MPVHLETKMTEVKDGHIVCQGKDGKDFTIKCDSVISSAGYVPDPLIQGGGNIHLVGDCNGVGNLRTVI